MADIDPDALQKFYENELKFTSGDTVTVFLYEGAYTYQNVLSCRILILSGEKILVVETGDAKYIFHVWQGVGFKRHKDTELQVG